MTSSQIPDGFELNDVVARRLQTLAAFEALDPWNEDRATEFRIEECVMTTVQKKIEPGKKWRWSPQLIALWSADARKEHFVPESLVELWRSGKVPPCHLPLLVKAAEEKLVETDYYLELHEKWKQRLGWIMGLFVFFFVFAFLYGGVVWVPAPLPASLSIAGAAAFLYGGLITIRLRTHRLRCLEQMRWAAAEEAAIALAETIGGPAYQPQAQGLTATSHFYVKFSLRQLATACVVAAAAVAVAGLTWR